MAAFNTLAFAEKLEDAGVDAKLSKAFSHAMQDIAMQDVATKSDLDKLRTDLRHDGLVVAGWLAGLIVATVGLSTAILGLILSN